jgi:hypothetical protein
MEWSGVDRRRKEKRNSPAHHTVAKLRNSRREERPDQTRQAIYNCVYMDTCLFVMSTLTDIE